MIPEEPKTPPLPRIALGMAYTYKPPAPSTTKTYRMERGFPFQRAGVLVQAVPQFKGLTIYAHNSASARGGLFNITGTPVNVTVPVRT